jgi:hypothetical protein
MITNLYIIHVKYIFNLINFLVHYDEELVSSWFRLENANNFWVNEISTFACSTELNFDYTLRSKCEAFLVLSVEAHRVVRRQESHTFQTVGSLMAMRLSALCTGRHFPQEGSLY